jgi:hypothetical protein
MLDTDSGALRHRRLPHRPVVLIGLLVISLLMTASPPPAAAGSAADWNATALNVLFAAGHNPVKERQQIVVFGSITPEPPY